MLWDVTEDVGIQKDLEEEKHERIEAIECLEIWKKEYRGSRRIVKLSKSPSA